MERVIIYKGGPGALMLIGSISFIIIKMDFDLEAVPFLPMHGIWGPPFPWALKYFSLTSRFLFVAAGSLPARLEGGLL